MNILQEIEQLTVIQEITFIKQLSKIFTYIHGII